MKLIFCFHGSCKKYTIRGLCWKILLATQFARFFTFDLFQLLILIPGVHCYSVLVFVLRLLILSSMAEIILFFHSQSYKSQCLYQKKVPLYIYLDQLQFVFWLLTRIYLQVLCIYDLQKQVFLNLALDIIPRSPVKMC